MFFLYLIIRFLRFILFFCKTATTSDSRKPRTASDKVYSYPSFRGALNFSPCFASLRTHVHTL